MTEISSKTEPSASGSNAEWQKRRENAVVRGVSTLLPRFVDRAENAQMWDVEGTRYIDFAGGIAVLNTGHLHPRVKAAVIDQLEHVSHTCFQINPYAGYVRLAERLNALVPGPGPHKTLLLTTGAEAVENAVKIARAHTGRPGVIAFSGAFHGRTMMGLALTGKVAPYKIGFGPLPSSVYHLPYPVAYHGVTVEHTRTALNTLFKTEVEPERVAAIIIEPVQGEGGFNVCPPDLMRALRQVCDEHGILLIADEVQTGFGRTGTLFAMEHYGVAPDLITMAKSLGGGMPISGVCGRAEIMDAPAPGGLGGTYAGNPLSTASALEVLKIFDDENLLEQGRQHGDHLRAALLDAKKKVPRIADVRGLGAMLAIELMDPDTKQPDAAFAKAVQAKALENGLILLVCGVDGNVIRFLFPLTITQELLDEGIGILLDALGA
jgi:4-aminobutyrate aminotransferase